MWGCRGGVVEVGGLTGKVVVSLWIGGLRAVLVELVGVVMVVVVEMVVVEMLMSKVRLDIDASTLAS